MCKATSVTRPRGRAVPRPFRCCNRFRPLQDNKALKSKTSDVDLKFMEPHCCALFCIASSRSIDGPSRKRASQKQCTQIHIEGTSRRPRGGLFQVEFGLIAFSAGSQQQSLLCLRSIIYLSGKSPREDKQTTREQNSGVAEESRAAFVSWNSRWWERWLVPN
jgi:hypothetical protein